MTDASATPEAGGEFDADGGGGGLAGGFGSDSLLDLVPHLARELSNLDHHTD